jgi:3-dehydroquinate synthase
MSPSSPPIPPIPDRVVRVELGERSYDAIVGTMLIPRVGPLTRNALGDGPARAMLVADSALPPPLVQHASASLQSQGFAVATLALDATEPDKSVRNAERISIAMASARLERRDPVIALGGGIIGDLAGFAASMYRRGVPVVQCPTTLLSMVDAAVGGKTGANLSLPSGELLKNLVGAFHQPSLVLADVDALTSLPSRHLRSGLAECLKHAMLALDIETNGEHPTDLFTATLDGAAACISADTRALSSLIARNIAIKARVVAADERELSTDAAGGRATLNLGHTFAHAIETIKALSPDSNPAHAPLHHGEAVALGLVAAANVGLSLGTLSAADSERVRAAVAALGLPDRVSGLPANEVLIARMQHDKKVSGGKLRLIVPHGIGRVQSHFDPPVRVIEAGWNAIRM